MYTTKKNAQWKNAMNILWLWPIESCHTVWISHATCSWCWYKILMWLAVQNTGVLSTAPTYGTSCTLLWCSCIVRNHYNRD